MRLRDDVVVVKTSDKDELRVRRLSLDDVDGLVHVGGKRLLVVGQSVGRIAGIGGIANLSPVVHRAEDRDDIDVGRKRIRQQALVEALAAVNVVLVLVARAAHSVCVDKLDASIGGDEVVVVVADSRGKSRIGQRIAYNRPLVDRPVWMHFVGRRKRSACLAAHDSRGVVGNREQIAVIRVLRKSLKFVMKGAGVARVNLDRSAEVVRVRSVREIDVA